MYPVEECIDCGRTVRYDEDGIAPGYHHTETPEVGCFMIRPELPDGSFEDGEWVAIPGRFG